MAYFSNGSHGEWFTEAFCSRCHFNPEAPEDGGCPIMLLHLMHNGDQFKGGKRIPMHFLDVLITDKGQEQECQFFIDRTLVTKFKTRGEVKGQGEMF